MRLTCGLLSFPLLLTLSSAFAIPYALLDPSKTSPIQDETRATTQTDPLERNLDYNYQNNGRREFVVAFAAESSLPGSYYLGNKQIPFDTTPHEEEPTAEQLEYDRHFHQFDDERRGTKHSRRSDGNSKAAASDETPNWNDQRRLTGQKIPGPVNKITTYYYSGAPYKVLTYSKSGLDVWKDGTDNHIDHYPWHNELDGTKTRFYGVDEGLGIKAVMNGDKIEYFDGWQNDKTLVIDWIEPERNLQHRQEPVSWDPENLLSASRGESSTLLPDGRIKGNFMSQNGFKWTIIWSQDATYEVFDGQGNRITIHDVAKFSDMPEDSFAKTVASKSIWSRNGAQRCWASWSRDYL